MVQCFFYVVALNNFCFLLVVNVSRNMSKVLFLFFSFRPPSLDFGFVLIWNREMNIVAQGGVPNLVCRCSQSSVQCIRFVLSWLSNYVTCVAVCCQTVHEAVRILVSGADLGNPWGYCLHIAHTYLPGGCRGVFWGLWPVAYFFYRHCSAKIAYFFQYCWYLVNYAR